jgi:hypothetical protein
VNDGSHVCVHCDAALVFTTVDVLLGVARKKRDVALIAALDQAQAQLGHDGQISLCPVCGCLVPLFAALKPHRH